VLVLRSVVFGLVAFRDTHIHLDLDGRVAESVSGGREPVRAGSALRRRGVRRDCPVRLDGTSQRRDDIDPVSASDVSVSAARVERGLGVSDARGQQVDEVVERDSRDRLGRSSGGGTARW